MKFSPRMVRLCLTLMAILALLLASVSFVASELKSKAAGASNHMQFAAEYTFSGLHVSGNELVNNRGQQVVLHGVNKSSTGYACVQGKGVFDSQPVDQNSVQAIKSWNVNVVRVTLNEDCWLGINGVNPASGGINYQQAIINYVNLLNQNNIYAIVDLHWNAPGTTLATGQQPMPDQDHAPAFWQSVANTFKNNPAVLFDLYNEPYPDNNSADSVAAWTCWRDGGTCSGVSYPAAGMQGLVTTVRNTGAQNVIMLGGIGWSGSLSEWLKYKPTDPANNIAASWHIYNWTWCTAQSCWDSQIAPVAASVPLITGEMGENDCADGFIDPLMNWLDQHNASYLAWSWDVTSCSSPSLITDNSGTPSNFGVGFKSRLLSFPTNPYPSSVATVTSTPPSTPIPTSQPSPTPASPGATVTPVPTTAPTSTPVLQPISTPAGVGSTSTAVPTAAPTDPPVPTAVPTSTPILQPASTPPPILWTPDPSFTTPVPLPPTSSDLVLYGDAGATGFVDHSFGYSSHNPCDTSLFVSPPCSYAISYRPYGAINFYHPNGAISTASYQALQYDLNTNHQPITDFSALFLNSHRRVIQQIRLSAADVTAQLPGGWVQISIPLSVLNPANVPITGLQLKNRTRWHLAPIHVDDVQLVAF